MRIPHLVMHASIGGRLGGFHHLAIVNNAAVDICVQVVVFCFFLSEHLFLILLPMYPRMELVVLWLIL